MKPFYSKILLFGEYGIIKNSKGLAIPYNFYKGTLKMLSDVQDGKEATAKNQTRHFANLLLTCKRLLKKKILSSALI